MLSGTTGTAQCLACGFVDGQAEAAVTFWSSIECLGLCLELGTFSGGLLTQAQPVRSGSCRPFWSLELAP